VVLEVLSRGRMYGYELSEAIRTEEQQGAVAGQGERYTPCLYNSRKQKSWGGQLEETEGGREKTIYSITSKGKGHLAAQKEQLKELAAGLIWFFGGALSTA